MAITAFSSQASKLQVSISSVFTDIEGVVTLPTPEIKNVFDDITSLSSTGGFPERISVGKDFTSIAFEMIWDPTNAAHDYIMDASVSGTVEAWKIIASDSGAATFAFSGIVSLSAKLETRKAGRVSGTIEVTGAVTYTQ